MFRKRPKVDSLEQIRQNEITRYLGQLDNDHKTEIMFAFIKQLSIRECSQCKGKGIRPAFCDTSSFNEKDIIVCFNCGGWGYDRFVDLVIRKADDK